MLIFLSLEAERKPLHRYDRYGLVDLGSGSCFSMSSWPLWAAFRDSPNGREFYAHSPLQKLKWEVRWRVGSPAMAQFGHMGYVSTAGTHRQYLFF